MLHQIILLLTLTTAGVLSSIDGEKIIPVDMKYNCMTIETGEGKKDLSPILLIHGVGGNWKMWKGVMQVLAFETRRDVCAVDLRNHGDSPWNNRTDVASLAVDIGHFLDKKGIQKVNIIGHSLGGKTAVHYTLNNPGRVDSIVVEDMRPNGVTAEAHAEVLALFELLKSAEESIPEGMDEDQARRNIIQFINDKLQKMGQTEKLPEESADELELISIDGTWKLKFNMEVIGKALKDADYLLTRSSGVYQGPALFIYGQISPFKVNEDKDNILKMFPKAKLVPVERAGHNIHGVFPQFEDEVVKLINNLN